MWELYDELIGGIPPEYRADLILEGKMWTMVRSGDSCGLAMTAEGASVEDTRPRTLPAHCDGMPLRDLAVSVKSWNFAEASLGLAAINAYWNSPEREEVARNIAAAGDPVNVWRERAAGKKAAVIGRFSRLEEVLADVCELSVLEKQPREGDFPDSACEYILSSQDFVFTSGAAIINKTLPRLLELSRKTGLILIGPGVPLASQLLKWGILDLHGFVVTNPEICESVISGNSVYLDLFDAGKRISISGDDRR
ncbi:MAG: DUF364 domain-containing protein [Treponema sp.]|jgi:uncharacterized protein (DUF4213/DUF364 family)|nr:DUF364 domain-containing protein [Treponema sp.]